MFIQTPYDAKKQLFAFIPETLEVVSGASYARYTIEAWWLKQPTRNTVSQKLNLAYGVVKAEFYGTEHLKLTYEQFLKEAAFAQQGFSSNGTPMIVKHVTWAAEVIWNTETVWSDSRTPDLETKLRMLMDNYSGLPTVPVNLDGWYRFSKSGK